jgi:DNA-directed RNA polymerase II subunit RPB9
MYSSNMLYPKEDNDTRQLQFACRTCQYSEPAISSCVFRNVLNNAVGETAGVTQDVGSDPTVCAPFSMNSLALLEMFCSIESMSANITVFQLPRSNKACPKCKAEDAVFFQSQQRSAETGMVLLSSYPLDPH